MKTRIIFSIIRNLAQLMMYLLKEIELKNIKGFENLRIDLTKTPCVPNKVNFIVGSNGRGKTTVATAFSKLTSNALQIDKEDKCNGSEDYSLSLKVSKDKHDIVYYADSSKNEISNNYDVTVVNTLSLLKSTTQRVLGNHVVAGRHIKSQKISIFNKNERFSLKYKQSDLRSKFPVNICKLLVNISELLKCESFVKVVRDFADLKSQKKVIKALETFENNLVKLGNKSKTTLVEQIKLNNLLKSIIDNEKLSYIFNQIKSSDPSLDDVSTSIIILQLFHLDLSKDDINKALDSFENDNRYKEIETSLCLIDPRKRFFSVVNGELVLEINNISSLSSGERDLLIMIAEMEKLLYRSRTNKDKILIFDDIFDYLDGANVLFFQYFILKIIKKFKREGKSIFIFLFTHLDPSFFSSFQMNSINIYNLESHKYHISPVVENMILNRDSLSDINKEILGKFYLHYSIEPFDLSKIEEPCSITDFFNLYKDPYKFKNLCIKEVKRFVDNKEFDIFMVSIGIRVICEKYLYDHLESKYKEQFLTVHGKKKIEMFDENNIYLDPMVEILNKTYNELEHVSIVNKEQKITRFFLKVNNLFIKSLIGQII